MRFRTVVAPAVVSVLVAACAQSPAPSIDLADEAAAVDAVSRQWLEFARAKDAAGVAGLFASDGAIFWENQEPVVGPAAIETYLVRNFEEEPDAVPDFGSNRIEVAASGDLAVEFGTWRPSGAGTDYGKYITIYRKVDGVWKVIGDMSLSTKPEVETSDD